MGNNNPEVLLEVKNLRVNMNIKKKQAYILKGVNLEVRKGEILGIVGESGCGKSVTTRTIIGLLPKQAEIVDGEVIFVNENLLEKSKKEMNDIRAKRIATIFQDPLTYLNPVLTIGTQIREAAKYSLTTNERVNKTKLNELSIEALKLARLPDPESLLDKYPFELSGGMRQRVMIAMAIVRDPELIIADEITTALDVTTQAELLKNFRKLQRDLQKTIIMVTHDMGVVATVCDRVAVMYAGQVVEVGDVFEIFESPKHPYTKSLLDSIPHRNAKKLAYIRGQLPDYYNPPKGCQFSDRCDFAMEHCFTTPPKFVQTNAEQMTACHLYSKGGEQVEETAGTP